MRVVKHSDPWDYFEVHDFFGDQTHFNYIDGLINQH